MLFIISGLHKTISKQRVFIIKPSTLSPRSTLRPSEGRLNFLRRLFGFLRASRVFTTCGPPFRERHLLSPQFGQSSASERPHQRKRNNWKSCTDTSLCGISSLFSTPPSFASCAREERGTLVVVFLTGSLFFLGQSINTAPGYSTSISYRCSSLKCTSFQE